jgi:hypothetical protein
MRVVIPNVASRKLGIANSTAIHEKYSSLTVSGCTVLFLAWLSKKISGKVSSSRVLQLECVSMQMGAIHGPRSSLTSVLLPSETHPTLAGISSAVRGICNRLWESKRVERHPRQGLAVVQVLGESMGMLRWKNNFWTPRNILLRTAQEYVVSLDWTRKESQQLVDLHLPINSNALDFIP